MTRFDVAFVIAAICYAILGIALGIWMGINQDFAPRHIHAHINLLGWTSLALYGLVHRAWPELRLHPLARLQFWTAMAGTPIFLIGLPLAMFRDQPVGAIVGSLLVLLAALMFGFVFWRTAAATTALQAERAKT
jgi:hypothetical protein